MTNIAMENHHFFIGKPSINGSCPMAMLNYQRVGQNCEFQNPRQREREREKRKGEKHNAKLTCN